MVKHMLISLPLIKVQVSKWNTLQIKKSPAWKKFNKDKIVLTKLLPKFYYNNISIHNSFFLYLAVIIPPLISTNSFAIANPNPEYFFIFSKV